MVTISQVERANNYGLEQKGKAVSHPTTENMMDSN